MKTSKQISIVLILLCLSFVSIYSQTMIDFDTNLVINKDRNLILPKAGTTYGQVAYSLLPEVVASNKKETYIIEFDVISNEVGKQPFSTMVIGKNSTGDYWSHRLSYENFTITTNQDESLHYSCQFSVDPSKGQQFGVSQRFISEREGAVGGKIINLNVKYIDDISIAKNLIVNRNLGVLGKVGIGVNYPQSTLDVNGTIRAKEVKIESTGWADFVFAPEYKLPTLSEVENHILEYGHLPDIPSETEVKENGVGVGEMQIKLLQKIEELTLYVIKQDKKIVEQQIEINNLKNKR